MLTIEIELEGDAYWLMHNEATSLSQGAKAVIQSATGVSGTMRRRVQCSRAVAEEIRDWFRDHARGYLQMDGHRHKAPVCSKAAEGIDSVLSR